MTDLEKRNNIRFEPDDNTLIWISKNPDTFEPVCVGLSNTESHQGCSFIINQDIGLNESDLIMLAIGTKAPLKSVVRWIKLFDKNIFLIGVEILE